MAERSLAMSILNTGEGALMREVAARGLLEAPNYIHSVHFWSTMKADRA